MSASKCIAIILLVSASGCSPRDSVGPEDFVMTGRWRHSGDLRDATTGDSHIHEGRFDLRQTASVFGGSGQQWGSCGDAHGGTYQGPLADPTPYPVTAGQVSGMTIQFKTDICEYAGSFEAGNPNRITGTGTCRYSRNGVAYTFTGQWQADRLP